jgi:hypothetical protein
MHLSKAHGMTIKLWIQAFIIVLVGLEPPMNRALAAEGGAGTYLLGSRDLAMGIVPGPGIYVSHEFTYYNGGLAAASSIAGVIVSDADVEFTLNKSVITAVSAGKIFGGSPGISIQFPFINANLDVAGSVTNPSNGNQISGNVDGGSAAGLGDIIVSPLIGWHAGKMHYSFAATMYLPTGGYELASIDVAGRSVDAVNTGKNRFAIDPTVSMTYLNPATGLEWSGAVGVVFSAQNHATNYQTGAELHTEATVAQRFKNGWVLGVSGGIYKQIEKDSGPGADQLTGLIDSDALKAQLFQVGPVISYSTKIGEVGVTFTGKYFSQFEGKGVFEGDSGWARLNLSF